MESILALAVFLAAIPLVVAISHFFVRTKLCKRLVLLLNLPVWSYEVFFLAAVCGKIPQLAVHFGAGLCDLLFIFALSGLILVHIIGLSVTAFKVSKAAYFLLPPVTGCIPLVVMHRAASEGHASNSYYLLFKTKKPVFSRRIIRKKPVIRNKTRSRFL